MQDFGSNSGGKQTLIEEGTHFKGSMSSNCPILVRGRIDGDVESPSLAVSATGAVHGRAKVTQLRSEGELSGEYDAETVQLSGTVRDNTVIRAKSLEIKLESGPGKMQVMFGECELSVGDTPVDAPAVADAAAAEQDGGRRGRRKRDEEVAIVRESEAPKAP
ncbi:MAG TPA: polymer-forming cytoskeletal protein [Polyangiaceae bacterium]|nr:polymer-forming cytoskeletal protein [Polyangiaceae bacterium]